MRVEHTDAIHRKIVTESLSAAVYEEVKFCLRCINWIEDEAVYTPADTAWLICQHAGFKLDAHAAARLRSLFAQLLRRAYFARLYASAAGLSPSPPPTGLLANGRVTRTGTE